MNNPVSSFDSHRSALRWEVIYRKWVISLKFTVKDNDVIQTKLR